jgi:parallel beta-helix repeat protein
MKNKNQLILIGIVILFFALGSIILNTEVKPINHDLTKDNIDSGPPRKSGKYNWVLGYEILDNNWTDAVAEGWCSGNGKFNDPYIIENVTFDGGGVNPCLEIQNSDAAFLINNCTFFRPGAMGVYPGLYLNNVDNGTIVYSNFSYSSGMGTGIRVRVSQNNTIENNTVQDCYDGIWLNFSPNNRIINNRIYNNRGEGILIESNSPNNNITDNRIYNSAFYGIQITSNSRIQVINNTIYNQPSDYGIQLSSSGSGNSDIINNTFIDLSRGMYIASSANSPTIEGNYIENCTYGIYSYFINNMIISGNEMIDCGIIPDGGTTAFNSLTIYTNNTVNGNPVYFYKNENNLDNSNFTKEGDPGQIILFSCDDSEIKDFNISRSTCGIELFYCERITIRNVTAKYNSYTAILLTRYNSRNTIYNNTLSNNVINGILLDEDSSENNITYNILKSNNFAGIDVRTRSNFNNFTYNTATSCNMGIQIYDSDNNRVFNNTFIDNSGNGIYIEGSIRNEINNNTINDNEWYGIRLAINSVENYIINNFVNETDAGYSQFYGIYLTAGCDNNTIYNNEVLNHDGDGIRLLNADDNKIFSNTLMSNAQHGINIYGAISDGSDENFIKNNTILNNGNNGINLQDSCDDNRILNNTVIDNTNNGIYLADTGSGCNYNEIINNTIYDNGMAGIYLYGECTYTKIINNTIKYRGTGGTQDYGIRLDSADPSFPNYTTIMNNTIMDHVGYGIWLNYDCDENDIIGNTIVENPGIGDIQDRGILLDSLCDYNNISGNIISGHSVAGIELGQSSKYNNISDNEIFDNNCGIDLNDGNENNTFHNNVLIDNTEYNICLQTTSHWNYITQNTLNNSKYGIHISGNCDRNSIIGNIIGNNTVIGVYLSGGTTKENNYFYENEFINNTQHAVDDMDVGTNYWYDPINKIGNFWDNYTGSDPNDDGIGNIPYNITGAGNRQDLYPICWDGQDVFPLAPAAGDDDDDDDDEDTGIVVVVVVVVILASIGGFIAVIYILNYKGIIDLTKLKGKLKRT